MLKSLRQDHVNIAKLLKVLEQKLVHIRQGTAVKYKLVADIISYMSDYADRFHHPKEDIVYEYYVKYRADDDPSLNDKLQQQHHHLLAMTAELSDTLDIILLDAVVPLDQFSDRLEAYIEAQWQHLNYEEEVVFPTIKERLTEDDWRAIEQSWQHSQQQEDPLFGHRVSEQYKALAERIALSDTAVSPQ